MLYRKSLGFWFKLAHAHSALPLPPSPPSSLACRLIIWSSWWAEQAIIPCFVFNPNSSIFSKATNQGPQLAHWSGFRLAHSEQSHIGNLGWERSRPHAPRPSITGEGEKGRKSRSHAKGRWVTGKLKVEALASASGQASRCGDPGLFDLKWWLRDHGP